MCSSDLRAAGRSTGANKIKIISMSLQSPASFQQILAGGQAAGIVVDPAWKGWATMDDLIRAMLGTTPGKENIPTRLATSANTPASGWPGSMFSTNYQAAYLKLWRLSQ